MPSGGRTLASSPRSRRRRGGARGWDWCDDPYVNGDEYPTERVVLQRMRNRAIEAVQLLAEGDAGVRSVGANEWINQFFDIVDDDSPGQWRSWSVWTREEVMRLGELHDLVLEVCRQTPQVLDDDMFVAAGWPSTIAPAARAAETVLRARGRFSEDAEETEPPHPERLA
jgi:hypothetical protein